MHIVISKHGYNDYSSKFIMIAPNLNIIMQKLVNIDINYAI